MSRLVKTNVPGLYKDMATGTILNKNIDEYRALKAKLAKSKEQTALGERVTKMEGDICDIKNLLIQLVKKA